MNCKNIGSIIIWKITDANMDLEETVKAMKTVTICIKIRTQRT